MAAKTCASVEGGALGCVVVFAAFSIQVFAFGTAQAIGIYNIEFLRYFDEGAAAVSLVGSINFGMVLGAGPLASMLMARWSHRQVALVGSALANIGLICMPFAPNLEYMYVFYGIVTGLGYCLVYVPSHVLSGMYFSEHRSLATGIATSGSGMGAIVLPLVMYVVIEHYGWQGSLFIIAGLNLHLFIFAALLFPVPAKLQRKLALQERVKVGLDEQLETNSNDMNTNGVVNKGFDSTEGVMDESCNEDITSSRILKGACDGNANGDILCDSAVSDKKPNEQAGNGRTYSVHVKDSNRMAVNGIVNNGCIDGKDDTTVKNHIHNYGATEDSANIASVHNNDKTYINGTRNRARKPGNWEIEIEVPSQNGCHGAANSSANGQDDKYELATVTNNGVGASEDNNIVVEMASFKPDADDESATACSMFRKHIMSVCTPDFIIYWLSNICWNAGLTAFLQFVPEFALSIGLEKDKASIVLMVVGIGSTVGCVLGGLLGNIKYINRINLYIFANLGCGFASLLTIFEVTHTLVGLLTACLLYGLMLGVILGLLVVVTSDLLGIDALGAGFGYLMFADGIGVFGGPPIAGLLIDEYGRIDLAMYVVGIFSIVGGLIMCLVPIRRKLCKKMAT